MAETCRQALQDVEINPARFALEWASAAEGPRFVELITNYVAHIKSLGPLGEGEGEPGGSVIKIRLEAATKAFEAPRVRTVFGNLAKKMNKAGDYSKEVITQGVSEKVFPAYRKERLTQEALMRLKGQDSMTISDLASSTGGSEEELNAILAALSKKGQVKEAGPGWALAQGEA